RRINGQDTAFVYDGDAVGNVEGEVAIVRDDKGGDVDAVLEILNLKHRIHVIFFVVFYDRDFVFGVADRIAVINEGCILAIDSPDEIKNNPDPLIQKFLNANLKNP